MIKNMLLIATLGLVFIGTKLWANDINQAVTQNINSPFVKFKSINIGEARWTEGFWAEKFELAEKVVIPHMGTLLKGDIGHAYNNFKIAAGLKEGKHKGEHWHDGDFYKWMESTMYLYAINRDTKLTDDLDEIIAVIEKAQRSNGYLSTSNQIKGIKPWTKRNHHELYNAGHLITAGIMHRRITGKDSLYNISLKNANYLYDTFIVTPKHLSRFGFNMSQIMALVELYREAKDKRFLDLAINFIKTRAPEQRSGLVRADSTSLYLHVGDMVQERTPLREETDAVGHAVLGMYLWSGAADIYAETGEKALLDSLTSIWDSANNRKMFIHGGIGQIDKGAAESFDLIHEGFIYDYMMPNSHAYAETCANIANAMFNFRLMGILGESKYADNVELVLYNSALSSLSADGKKYFYTNPPRKVNGVHDYDHLVNESAVRQDYIKCFCCPPNIARTLAKLSGWAYSISDNGIVVNLYGGNTLVTKLLDGSELKLTQVTNYPWDGAIEITIDKAKPESFDIRLRIPGWSNAAIIKVNGVSINAEIKSGSYAVVNRKWQVGDKLTVDFPMEIKFMEGDPRIEEVRNEVAVKRGPIVYALETVDLPAGTSILDAYISSDNANLVATHKKDFLGGVTTIEGNVLLRKFSGNGMYREVKSLQLDQVKTQFIPYYAWSNRGDEANEMTVFLPIYWEAPSENEEKEDGSSWWPF